MGVVRIHFGIDTTQTWSYFFKFLRVKLYFLNFIFIFWRSFLALSKTSKNLIAINFFTELNFETLSLSIKILLVYLTFVLRHRTCISWICFVTFGRSAAQPSWFLKWSCWPKSTFPITMVLVQHVLLQTQQMLFTHLSNFWTNWIIIVNIIGLNINTSKVSKSQ